MNTIARIEEVLDRRANKPQSLEVAASPIPAWSHHSPIALKPKFTAVLDEYLAAHETLKQAEMEEFPAYLEELRDRKDVAGSELNNFFESLGG